MFGDLQQKTSKANTHSLSFIAMDLSAHLNALVVISQGIMPSPSGLLHHALCCSLVFICLLLLKNMSVEGIRERFDSLAAGTMRPMCAGILRSGIIMSKQYCLHYKLLV